jgi:hypothetical protein
MQVSEATNQSVWKQVYQDALFEVDETRLKPKLEAALKEVEDRLFEVRSDPATSGRETHDCAPRETRAANLRNVR